MRYGKMMISWMVSLALVGILVGCGSSAPSGQPKASKPAAPASSNAAEKPAEAAKDAGPAHAMSAVDADVAASLAKLSPEDRALAEKQKICPVTGEVLGSMDTPVKTTVKDKAGKIHTVFLCCQGCDKKLQKDPDKYLEKIKDVQ